MKTTKRISLTSFFLVLSFATTGLAKANIADRQLQGDLKKQMPLVLVDKAHGQMKLTRNESFAILGKGRFGVAGSWAIEGGKLVLLWQNSGERLEVDVKKEKDGLRLDGQAKDAKGEYHLSAD